MIPLSAIKACTLPEVSGPGILFPADQDAQTFLVTGADSPVAVLLDGQHKCYAFPASKGHNWKGAIIEPVNFEIDESSIYSPSSVGLKLGSIIVKGRDAFIVARMKTGGWEETISVPISQPVDGADEHDKFEVGFYRWKAVIGEGEQRATVFEFAPAEN